MRALHGRAGALLAALAVFLAAPALAAGSERYRFTTLEGTVGTVGEHQAEGELRLLSVELETGLPERDKVTVLLGPAATCREIGLVVEEGDRVRVKVFVGEEGEPLEAQKILNMSRSVMVRLRSMRNVPLWSANGAWEGGPGRAWRGGRHGARHGGGGPGRAPGRP